MDIFIHPNRKPVSLIVYRNNDPRNVHVHREFKFGDFGLSEWDELNAIIPTKRNKCLKDMMTSLRNKYKRLKKVPEGLGLDESLPLLEQDPSLRIRKRKAMELKHETYIAGLHCHRELPKGVKFVNNLVIKQHGLFFINAFGEEAFQRVDDVYKVETETLLVYKVMASNVKTDEKLRFNMLISEMINKNHDKGRILSKLMCSPFILYVFEIFLIDDRNL
ncbi:hypothetical protein Tco_0911077 [Tanacetum coccineum]|uniref:Uncharacterized protein n=1 Tax=Tanacetum coccineum TaxID=301880 RepID=A0ABQ5CWE7_9ASTR